MLARPVGACLLCRNNFAWGARGDTASLFQHVPIARDYVCRGGRRPSRRPCLAGATATATMAMFRNFGRVFEKEKERLKDGLKLGAGNRNLAEEARKKTEALEQLRASYKALVQARSAFALLAFHARGVVSCGVVWSG